MTIALIEFKTAMAEIEHLISANPSKSGKISRNPHITRVLNRATIVLMTSHFEQYLHAMLQETADTISQKVKGETVPQKIKLLHSEKKIEALYKTNLDNRVKQLAALFETESWLWRSGERGDIEAGNLSKWMKTPNSENVIRFYRNWGIENIFDSITKKRHIKGELYSSIESMVVKRNSIAHGNFTETATIEDVKRYKRSIETFCNRADNFWEKFLEKTFLRPAI